MEILSKEEYIARHLETCNAKQCKKYDPRKPTNALHSIGYSRLKCAKNGYRRYIRRLQDLKIYDK